MKNHKKNENVLIILENRSPKEPFICKGVSDNK